MKLKPTRDPNWIPDGRASEQLVPPVTGQRVLLNRAPGMAVTVEVKTGTATAGIARDDHVLAGRCWPPSREKKSVEKPSVGKLTPLASLPHLEFAGLANTVRS